jgi:hypothetical protein
MAPAQGRPTIHATVTDLIISTVKALLIASCVPGVS